MQQTTLELEPGRRRRALAVVLDDERRAELVRLMGEAIVAVARGASAEEEVSGEHRNDHNER